MNSAPSISVIMSVHNTRRHLDEAVESILQQTFDDFEFLIVDDGSTDGSSERLAQYAAQDQRVRIIPNDTNIGLTKSLNVAIHQSRGALVARQDADDISEPNRFAQQIKAFEEDAGLLALGTFYKTINEDGQVVRSIKVPTASHEIAWQLLFHNAFCHSSMMFRREGLGDTPVLYDEDFQYSQDYELWSRLIEKGTVSNLPETLVRYRINTHSISGRLRPQQQKFANKVSARNIARLDPTLNMSEDDLLHLRGVFQHGIRSLFGRDDFVAARNLLRIWEKFLHTTSTPQKNKTVWRNFWRRLGNRPIGRVSQNMAMRALSHQLKATS